MGHKKYVRNSYKGYQKITETTSNNMSNLLCIRNTSDGMKIDACCSSTLKTAWFISSKPLLQLYPHLQLYAMIKHCSSDKTKTGTKCLILTAASGSIPTPKICITAHRIERQAMDRCLQNLSEHLQSLWFQWVSAQGAPCDLYRYVQGRLETWIS